MRTANTKPQGLVGPSQGGWARVLLAIRAHRTGSAVAAEAILCDMPRLPIPKTKTHMLLSDQDKDMLLGALHAKSPEVVQARMANALLLLSDGLSVEDVAGLLFLNDKVVAGWQAMFSKRAKAA
jgi:hypothetical protein